MNSNPERAPTSLGAQNSLWKEIFHNKVLRLIATNCSEQYFYIGIVTYSVTSETHVSSRIACINLSLPSSPIPHVNTKTESVLET
jgi:hypothetical protein